MKHTNAVAKIRQISTVAVFAGLLLLFGIGSFLMPDKELSVYERRELEQVPVYGEYEDLASYFSAWEPYLADQFPFRDELRFLKSGFAHIILQQYDVNGYYSEGGSQAEILYPMNEELMTDNILTLEEIRESYFTEASVYYGVIPDKSYYMDAPLGLDYDKIHSLFAATLQAKQIPIEENLTLKDYYRTDIHWKQESLEKVYSAMGAAMNPALPQWNFTEHTAGKFYGGLYGQAAMPAKKDEMRYLTSAGIDDCRVTVYDLGKNGEVIEKNGSLYDMEGFKGNDPYDLFMGGESGNAVVRIVNPNAATNKKLILFRDSFGRSIAPLLAAGYSEIVLIDLRWVKSFVLPYFGDCIKADENTDVLFLYSAQVLHSTILM